MKKLALFAVLTGMMWAGVAGGVTEEEAAQEAAEIGPKLLATQKAAQCGLGCPAGYHPSSYYCDVSCGQCVNNCSNATSCQPNDSSFDTCGSCPPGYRTNFQYCNVRCIVCGASCFGLNNASSCSKL